MAASGASYIAGDLAVNLSGDVDQANAVKRIINRIHGFQSNFHPEDLSQFFRNVFAVEKMLTVAEQLKSRKNQKLKIGFNYGAAHSGMEDLLRAGPEVCRAIINHYPKEYLEYVAETNSSLENLCSVMVVDLPKDFKIDDLDDYDKATKIPGQRIVDKKLYEQLSTKLKAK